MTKDGEKCLIIGAGISGLTLAHRLKNAQWNVTLLENSNHTGGAIQTSREKGYLVESGPNTIQLTNRQTENFLHESGLKEEIVRPGPESQKRFLYRDGHVHPLPVNPLGAITTPLFSFKGKLRLAAELFIKARHSSEEESLASFARRRVGTEFLDYALNPMAGGIYAGDPEKLSVRHAFPKVYHLEKNYGGLIRGALHLKRERAKAGDAYPTQLISFRSGMQTLPDKLSHHLGTSLHTGATITSIRRNPLNWEVSWNTEGAAHPFTDSFDHLILSLPTFRLTTLPFASALKTQLSPLADLEYPPLSSLALGFTRAQIRHPLDGFGILIPEKEQRRILGTLFSSSLFPGRAPKDHVLLTTFIGGTRQPHLASLEHDLLVATVIGELHALLDIKGDPLFIRHTFWPHSIPQYNLNYGDFEHLMDKIEKEHPGLHFCGNYRHGISVEKCILGALKMADRLLA